MAQKAPQKQSKKKSATTGDRFEWLARVMKEEIDDVRTELRTEIQKMDVGLTGLRKEVHDLETGLRKEIRDVEENLQYRIAKVSTDMFRHSERSVEPRIDDHERRIKKLEILRRA